MSNDLRSFPTWFQSGLDAAKGTPAYLGQTYFATDTGNRYIATGTSSSGDWVSFSSAIPTPTEAGQLIVCTAPGTYGLIDPANSRGQILVTNASGVPTLLTVGANDQTLLADSTTATGVKWAAPLPKTSARIEGVNGTPTYSVSAVIDWATESYDDANFWTSADRSRLTIATAGRYRVSMNLYSTITINSTADVTIRLLKNGTSLSVLYGRSFSTTTTEMINGAWEGALAATDYLQWEILLTNSATLSPSVNAANSRTVIAAS